MHAVLRNKIFAHIVFGKFSQSTNSQKWGGHNQLKFINLNSSTHEIDIKRLQNIAEIKIANERAAKIGDYSTCSALKHPQGP